MRDCRQRAGTGEFDKTTLWKRPAFLVAQLIFSTCKGGSTAVTEWPRLAEYFARFQLIIGLKCSIEILAPTLSPLPLAIRPSISHVDAKAELCRAVELYLERQCPSDNVAHALVPIRLQNDPSWKDGDPQMEVGIAVLGVPEHMEELEDKNNKYAKDMDETVTKGAATMSVVRIVNHTPLLDSTEAIACGIVQGIVSKKKLWNSYGLEVSLDRLDRITKIPTFVVKDSDQLTPFFVKGTHHKFKSVKDDTESDDECFILDEHESRKRKRTNELSRLSPAEVNAHQRWLFAHSLPSNIFSPFILSS